MAMRRVSPHATYFVCIYYYYCLSSYAAVFAQAVIPSQGLDSNNMVVDGVSRIVGGSQITDRTRFPYLAFSSGVPACGGTLIWTDILITAGHCEAAFTNQGVRIGGIEAAGVDGEYHPVEQVLVHPNYPVVGTQPYDIMLVKLNTSTTIQPVTLAASIDQPEVGSVTKILGFGYTSDGGTLSDFAKEVDVNVIDFVACNDLYEGKLLENVQFCAQGTNGDSCQGDSGGPLLNQFDELVGVVSFGEGCNEYPSVNTRVSNFIPWIQQGICDLSNFPPASCFEPQPTPTQFPVQLPVAIVVPPPTISPIINAPTLITTTAPTNRDTTNSPISTTNSTSTSSPTNVPSVAPTTNIPATILPTNIPSNVPFANNVAVNLPTMTQNIIPTIGVNTTNQTSTTPNTTGSAESKTNDTLPVQSMEEEDRSEANTNSGFIPESTTKATEPIVSSSSSTRSYDFPLFLNRWILTISVLVTASQYII